MPKRVNILRLISLFLVLLVLIGTITANSGLIKRTGSKSITAKHDKSDQKEHQKQTTIQAVSFEAIVSFIHFDLTQDFHFDFTPTFSKLLVFKEYSFEKPLFIISYFKNTFCHHIAINAP